MQSCTKKSEEALPTTAEALQPTPARPVPEALAPAEVPAEPIVPVAPLRQPPPPPEKVPTLESRYQDLRSTAEERDEIVKALGSDDSPQAMPALKRIFEVEKRQDLRMRVIEVVADRKDTESQPLRWEILCRAAEARQPALIRLGAMAALQDVDDPRVIPLLKTLSHDPSATIRENATRILQELQP